MFYDDQMANMPVRQSQEEAVQDAKDAGYYIDNLVSDRGVLSNEHVCISLIMC